MFKSQDEFENESENFSQTPEAETIIGPMVKVEGEFVGKGNVMVAGEIIGNISTDKSLIIEEGAKVKADISAKDIKIAGEAEGKVDASDRIELTSTAKVKGNINAKVLVVNPGAAFNGECNMNTAESQTNASNFENDQQSNSSKKKKQKED